MEESHSSALATVDLAILKVLWTDWFTPDGTGLTRNELAKQLNTPTTVVKTDAALRQHISKLTDDQLIVFQKRQTNKPGGKPNVYTIAVNSIITWPSTAYMLVELARVRPSIERTAFVRRMLELKIQNSSTGEIATQDEIERQLATCSEWGYINYINETVMLPSDRLKFELEYLKFVASHLK